MIHKITKQFQKIIIKGSNKFLPNIHSLLFLHFQHFLHANNYCDTLIKIICDYKIPPDQWKIINTEI